MLIAYFAVGDFFSCFLVDFLCHFVVVFVDCGCALFLDTDFRVVFDHGSELETFKFVKRFSPTRIQMIN